MLLLNVAGFQSKNYRKIPKISSTTCNTKNLSLNRPSKISTPPPPPGLVLGICLQVKSKTKKNGKVPSKKKSSPIDFETQMSLVT